MREKTKLNVRTMALLGLLAALVFVLSKIEIPIPLGLGDNTRIHFGNVMCLLSGVLFGPWMGGFAAGLGSMLFDFTDPRFFSESWITFLTKFAMGFLAGWLHRHALKKLPRVPRVLLSALGGSLLYVVLYMAKTAIMQHFVYGNPMSAVWVVVGAKGLVSLVNGAIAVAACTLLAPPLGSALESAGFLRRQHGGRTG